MVTRRRLRDPFDGDERPDRDGGSETEPGLAGALTDLSSNNMVGAHQRAVEPAEEPTTTESMIHDLAPRHETVFATSAVDPAGAVVEQGFSDVSGLGEVPIDHAVPADALAVDDVDGIG